ncbi:MAG: polysaccharide deacetylase family protein, partial [Armatimonadetes bacterium]|nr:polysaccharide deacetylase family protein [Armatimonadota bacterium]
MPKKSIKNLREIASTALDLILLRYPGFVYGESCSRAMPVFCFHGVEPESFEAMLAFLDTNGYVTLDADQYYALVTGLESAPQNAVVLTFDDGWGSLWSIGSPLLKRYAVKIVVFLP